MSHPVVGIGILGFGLGILLTLFSCAKQSETTLNATEAITKEVAVESLALQSKDGELWSIGKRIEKDLLERKNTTISTLEFGVEFGPIDGYDDGTFVIGWNDRHRLLYASTVSPEMKTVDGFSVGSRKSEIIDKLGKPVVETGSLLRYQNAENELVGILFYLSSEGVVTKMVLFSYV